MLISSSGTDRHFITYSLRAIIGATNAAILRASAIEKQQSSLGEPRPHPTSPSDEYTIVSELRRFDFRQVVHLIRHRVHGNR